MPRVTTGTVLLTSEEFDEIVRRVVREKKFLGASGRAMVESSEPLFRTMCGGVSRLAGSVIGALVASGRIKQPDKPINADLCPGDAYAILVLGMEIALAIWKGKIG